MWVTAHLEYAGLGSYRLPGHSSQYAAASPVPGPSAVKLGVVSVAIQRSKRVAEGERAFGVIKAAEVAYGLPIQVAISSVLVKRLKQKKGGGGLEPTYGIRGYAHLGGPLVIGLDIPDEAAEYIRSLLLCLRYLGTSDSIVTCTRIVDGPPPRSVRASNQPTPQSDEGRYLVVPLKDFQPSASYDQVSRHARGSPARALRDVYYLFPVQASETLENGFRYIFDIQG